MSALGPTRLQAATVELAALVRSARDELDDDAYRAFTFTATLLLAREGDRLAFGEALSALREGQS